MGKRIVILGAGPTGLGAAYRLQELGYENWALYEKNDYIGGLSASFKDERGFTWDIGGHIIFSVLDRFNSLVDTLLGDKVVSHVRESWVWLLDTFIRYPFQNNIHFLPKEACYECVMGLIENLRQPISDPHNFRDWIIKIFGSGIAKYFMLPYNRKVWAIDPTLMDFNWIAERVSVVDVGQVLKNLIYQESDHAWGPNNYFTFPLFGGTGGLFDAFKPYIKSNLFLEHEYSHVDSNKKEIYFGNNHSDTYDILISTIPVNILVQGIKDTPAQIAQANKKIVWTSCFVIGIGIEKPCPSKKNWMYFPQNDSPFYRVTYLSNYSPNMTPDKDRYFSFLAETSYSSFKKVSRDTIVEETITGLINSKLLSRKDCDRIVSTYCIDAPYSLPVPFLGRDDVMTTIQDFLQPKDIFSRGRFGAWKYEIGNMDHSVIQGMEIVDKLLLGEEEKLYVP
jgi:protoporphyrinogen oxidase